MPELAQDQRFDEIERAYPDGMSVQQIVESCAAAGDRLTEATFRKYVQLGLLPRSVRVGKKGKHRGSQGLYPASTVRQVQLIRRYMAQGFTMEDIKRRILFARSDIDGLATQIDRIVGQFERAGDDHDELVQRELLEVRRMADALLTKLRLFERRLSSKARLERAAV